MAAALNAALADALAADERTLVFGEDVGALGGVFRVTDGLQATFGRQRVFNTPVSEAGIAGLCVGFAIAGWRPVAEMQFDAWSYPALEQIIDHVAKYRNRSRGRIGMPVTIRIPSFGGLGGKEHHGESPETLYAHTPGLKVVVPSGALDAYRLLRLSIDDPDPVIFLEPKSLYRVAESGALTADGPPIGRARVVREGDACVVIAYGAMVPVALEAGDRLEREGVSCCVVDLRSLVPLDVGTVVDRVRETGRAVVVHEAPRTLGMGAEIAARITEEAFDELQAPVTRITGPDVPYPPASLEPVYRPDAGRVVDAVRRTLARGRGF
jgi:2-oxoisovalerate dehydrogenase E1 component subunit beta